jgi:WD40 repeat protein
LTLVDSLSFDCNQLMSCVRNYLFFVKFNRASISALAFSSEGAWMVSGSKDCTIFIWNTTTWNVVRKLDNIMGEHTRINFS